VKEASGSFLKKEPKNFCSFELSPYGEAEAKRTKVFCFFFSKKKALPLTTTPPMNLMPISA
jgi:hypothetical protein